MWAASLALRYAKHLSRRPDKMATRAREGRPEPSSVHAEQPGLKADRVWDSVATFDFRDEVENVL